MDRETFPHPTPHPPPPPPWKHFLMDLSLPFIISKLEILVGKSMVCTIPLRKLQRLWATGDSNAVLVIKLQIMGTVV